MKRFKILFFTPHIDDIEFGVPFTFLESLRLGNEVVEVLMTNCEFGTHRIEFKGDRLKRIRTRELENANNVYAKYTKNHVRVLKVGYIDGYLPMNKSALNKVVDIIRTEKPDIIFAPDPWYALDYHPDHINTGRLPYFALKKLSKNELPTRVFYYYSFKPNFKLKCRWKDIQIIVEALSQHRSQVTPLSAKLVGIFRKLLFLRRFFSTGHFTENFREQIFHDGCPEFPKKHNFLDNIKYLFFTRMTVPGYEKFHNVTPEELGLRT